MQDTGSVPMEGTGSIDDSGTLFKAVDRQGGTFVAPIPFSNPTVGSQIRTHSNPTTSSVRVD